jgi:tetraacyldisaccharide 4'-kinase
MIREWIFKLLLFPFSLLYGAIVSIRNGLYDRGVFRSASFALPTIGIGNLSVGGTGKTPHVEYLITLLKDYVQVAVLSRGYKRKTNGFLMVDTMMSAYDCGDEPLQFKRKYPYVHVAVSESRMLGVPRLLGAAPDTQVVLLDDVFQHRSVQPYINILLTEYSRPYFKDTLLPSGRLREWRSGSARADGIIITKCPADLQAEQRQNFLEAMEPEPGQEVFFSQYQYGYPYYMYNPAQRLQLVKGHNVLLLTAIAHTDYLLSYVEPRVNFVRNIAFEDHKDFSNYDLAQIKKVFDNMEMPYKFILTTEKDAVRLDRHREFLIQHRIPVFVLPVRVQFLFDDGARFDSWIQNRLLEFKA